MEKHLYALIPQLQKMLKRNGFYNKLDFTCQNGNQKGISDVLDGSVHKAHQKMLLKTFCTFQWYTAFGSSSVWPFVLVSNKQPFSERFKKENMFVPAVWCGPTKPHGNVLLKNTLSELLKLWEGVDLEINELGVEKVKFVTINGTADGPARCMMLNISAQNRESSCQTCYQKGEPQETYFGVWVFHTNRRTWSYAKKIH